MDPKIFYTPHKSLRMPHIHHLQKGKTNPAFNLQVKRTHRFGSSLKRYVIGTITKVLQKQFQCLSCKDIYSECEHNIIKSRKK